MRVDLLKGPLLVLVWQVAPLGVQQDSAGRVQLSLGYGAGQFEDRTLNCAGDLVSAGPVPFRAGGAQVDVWTSESPVLAPLLERIGLGELMRASAFGGLASGGADGAWGGIQAAVEGPLIGAGFGVAHTPFPDMPTVPSTYLRLGNRDRVHLRAETFPPTTAIGLTGDVFRLGLGYNRGLRRGPRWFVGANLGPYMDERGGGGVFGEVEVPVGPGLDLALGASLRDATQYFDGGGRVGLRYHFK